MPTVIMTPMGVNPKTCETCGEWIGASMRYQDALHQWSTAEDRLREALRQIARIDYDNWSGDPSKWASEIAYVALGGRYNDGQRVDNPDEL